MEVAQKDLEETPASSCRASPCLTQKQICHEVPCYIKSPCRNFRHAARTSTSFCRQTDHWQQHFPKYGARKKKCTPNGSEIYMVQEKNINQSVPNYIYFMCMQKRDMDTPVLPTFLQGKRLSICYGSVCCCSGLAALSRLGSHGVL